MKANYQKTLSALSRYLADPSADAKSDHEMPFDESRLQHGDMDATNVNDPFEPTGNATLDRIITNARPRFAYGFMPANQWSADAPIDGYGHIDGSYGAIGMPHRKDFRSDADYRAILAHELVHWTKAKGRSERPHGGVTVLEHMFGLFPVTYKREELVAELGAAMLLDAVGEPPAYKERAAYVSNWLSAIEPPERPEAMAWATERAKKAVNWLLSFAEK